MTQTKAELTPGPWHLNFWIKNKRLGHGKPPRPMKVIGVFADTTLNPTVAHVIQSRDQEANARLIAAAPELLEALEATLPFAIRFSQHVADEFGVVHAELIKAIEISEAAIRKARGEA